MVVQQQAATTFAAGAAAGVLACVALPILTKAAYNLYLRHNKLPNTDKYKGHGAAAHKYLVSVACRQTPELIGLHRETFEKVYNWAMMVSPPDAVAIHQVIAKLVNAKKIVEVGVFTGYTTLGMALALPAGGKIVACDVSDEWASIGKPYWQQAGVADKIDLRIGPAARTMQGLIDAGEAGTYDIAFLDADKINYDTYYELAMQLVRRGGVIMIDNVIWPGTNMKGPGVEAIAKLNQKVFTDARISNVCMLTNSDGITLAIKA